jgi:maltooligosyltrehalose trehalohydrolase
LSLRPKPDAELDAKGTGAPRLTLGAITDPGGTRFRVQAPRATRADLVLETPVSDRRPMIAVADGCFEVYAPEVRAGQRYRMAADDLPPFPDPASRFQPEGVHGPSEVVDPLAFAWTDTGWTGVPLGRSVLYELHVGTFTPEGTFDAAREKLPQLRDLGITAIEMLPLADFPGNRNWGYDGAALFAPARCYGTPDSLRRLIDAAHGLGIAVHLDVVYNHLGPDGAYAAAFNPDLFSDQHRNPWGAGIRLSGPRSAPTRAFFIENALHWVREYHMDGLRLDATHAMVDESDRHFMDELAAAVHAAEPGREVLVIAEDGRNWDRIVRRHDEGGMHLDGVWSDDFHHVLRRHLAGDTDGYFAESMGTTAELARTIEQGWLHTGMKSEDGGAPRGTNPAGIPPGRFVCFIQNHDQVGNRALGERLHHTIETAAWRAATALLFVLPQTPLLFMGQEWEASAPFRFFTDHPEPLGAQVTEGRRAEFSRFAAWADPAMRSRIPDPQAQETFEACRLDWSERERPPHEQALAFSRRLLALRASHPAMQAGGAHAASTPDAHSIVVERTGPTEAGMPPPRIRAVVRLSAPGTVTLPAAGTRWRPICLSEDPAFATDPTPATIESGDDRLTVTFIRPGAVVLEPVTH